LVALQNLGISPLQKARFRDKNLLF